MKVLSAIMVVLCMTICSGSVMGQVPVSPGLEGSYVGTMTTSTAGLNFKPKPIKLRINAQINQFGFFQFFNSSGNLITDGEGVIGTQQGLVFFTNDGFIVQQGTILVKGKTLTISGTGYVEEAGVNDFTLVSFTMKLKKASLSLP